MTLFDILDTIDRQIPRGSEETIPLLDALGRVAARSLSAPRHVPPFDISALDGYAVRGAGTDFRLRGSLEPHDEAPLPLKEGEAVFVPTGGRFPRGSRFAAREHVSEKTDCIKVETGADERKVVRSGDWLKKGQPLIGRGDVVSPAAMGLLAQGGHVELKVFKKPAVALIMTGSELKKGSVADSNKFLLAGLVRRDGGSVTSLHTVDDDDEQIRHAMRESAGARLFILTGGTSKGKKDLTKEAVRRLGFRFHLDSPPILPGKTMAFGRKGPRLFFILPGNPRAVQSLYELFVKRALLGMAGRPLQRTQYTLPLSTPVEKRAGIAMVIPVRICAHPAKIEEMYPRAPDGFVVLEEGMEKLAAGEEVRVLRV
jgi:molybdenum cofactor synthesis domain-containing protein